jgi:hypothetical protein
MISGSRRLIPLSLVALFLTSCGGSGPSGVTPNRPSVAPASVLPCGIEGTGIHIQDCSNGGGDQKPQPVTGLTMTTARAEHTATTLHDGKVLVAGGVVLDGSNRFSTTASAELYDPVTGTFSPTGDLHTARGQHVAVLLADGKVLVAGGLSDVSANTHFGGAETYDPSTGTFTPTGSMISSGRVSSAVLLPDGRVFISQDGTNAEIYDPATGTFTLPGAYNNAAVQVDPATLLPNGLVLVTGCAANCTVGMTALFDPKTNKFSPTGPYKGWGDVNTATLLTDGSVLFVEANDGEFPDDVEIYAPISGTFTHIRKTGYVHEYSTATRLPDGTVLVAGGQLAGGSGSTAVERYVPTTGAVVTATSLIAGRHNHTATLLPDGTVLIAGGYTGWPAPTASAEIYK